MKLSFSQACAEAKVSAIALMVHGCKLGFNFEEIYPEIDENAFQVIKALVTPAEKIGKVEAELAMATQDLKIIADGFPENAPRVLQKLKTKGFWGGHTVQISTLKTTFLKRVKNIDEVLTWLAEHQLIAYGYGEGSGKHDSISLVSAMKKEVQAIADLAVQETE